METNTQKLSNIYIKKEDLNYKISCLLKEKTELDIQTQEMMNEKKICNKNTQLIINAKIKNALFLCLIFITSFLFAFGLNLTLSLSAIIVTTLYLIDNNTKLLRSKKILSNLNSLEIEGIINTISSKLKTNNKLLTSSKNILEELNNLELQIKDHANEIVNSVKVLEEEPKEEKVKVKTISKKYN